MLWEGLVMADRSLPQYERAFRRGQSRLLLDDLVRSLPLIGALLLLVGAAVWFMVPHG